MPSSVSKTKKTAKPKKSAPRKTTTKAANGAHKATTTKTVTSTVIEVAPATVRQANGAHDEVYKDAVAEIKSLSDNDSHARKVDNGPLNEARGKDTWRLHAQLRAVDQLDKNVHRHVLGMRGQLQEIDDHLHTDAVAITGLIDASSTSIAETIQSTRKTLADQIKQTRDALDEGRENDIEDLRGRVDNLQKTVEKSFDKLAQATAGTEENLRTQTTAFSKAVEELLGSLQHDVERRISDFRDESTRQVDKRFNQSDVAFAAVRADMEVVKALLTDIIKDRMGRPERRGD